MQHRLRLVVGRVAGGDPLRPDLRCHPREPVVPHPPGRRFEVRAGRFLRQVDARDAAFHPQRLGQLPDERLVRIGLRAAELVVDVGHREAGAANIEQCPQQGNAVRPAGHGHHPRPAAE